VSGTTGLGTAGYEFLFRAEQHEPSAKEFSFPIYSSRGRHQVSRILPRSGEFGMQDGIDLIHALAFHPETARRMARRLWTWFVSETEAPAEGFVRSISRVYLENGTDMRAVMRAVLLSAEFQDPAHFYQRYAWPVEFVVRAVREVGHVGFTVNNAITPLLNMGQQLFEPPDVNGWELGPAWFSTGGTLARMNFAALLATNQRVALREAARPYRDSPEALIGFATRALSVRELPPEVHGTLVNYIRSGDVWTGSESQLLTKTAGVFHLLVSSGEYQVI
jgi:uncharacterized protein (DUF1800 family)